jgi:hypothetical protein
MLLYILIFFVFCFVLSRLWNFKLRRLRSRAGLIVVLCVVAASGGACLYLRYTLQRVTESKTIENFNTHRAAYERLRDMLQEEEELLTVNNHWGISKHGLVYNIPPAGGFPVDRYKEYLALLKETGANSAYRHEGLNPDVSIGGDRRHASVVWMNRGPGELVTSLEEYSQTPPPHHPKYRHLDGNWYLWANW